MNPTFKARWPVTLAINTTRICLGRGKEKRPWPLSLATVKHHPHFEYPQFKQVWHPSISTSACVLHLAQSVAPGGKPEASLVAAEADWLSPAEPAPTGAAAAAAAGLAFAFSYAARFSAMSLRVASLISGSWIRPIDFMCCPITPPISATMLGM